MLKPGKTYEDVYNSFKWQIPEFYNIGVDICDKWADQGRRLALIYADESGRVVQYTFRDLKNLSNKLATDCRPQYRCRGSPWNFAAPMPGDRSQPYRGL